MQNEQILNIFEGFRMAPTAIDQYHSKGKAILDEKLSTFTTTGKPIEFSMLGFPFKSMNDRDKVLGALPDLGEELTLKNFQEFNLAIKKVYSPGVKINMVSDGYMFNDLMDIPDTRVAQYNEISQDFADPGTVQWHDLNTFYSQPVTVARNKVMDQWGITQEQMEQRILFDPDVNFLYRGMIRFMSADLAIRDYDSGNQLHKAAKKLAREMMLRNEAYSRLVQTEFKDKIRLSMHPSVNSGTKYSFQLIPGPKAWTSPWHCAIYMHPDGTPETIHRKDAEASGYSLQYKNNQPYYFTDI